MPQKLYLLHGMISSGKSTYCQSASNAGQIICSDDDVVKMVHGGNYLGYKTNLKRLYKTIENEIINSGMLMGFSVVVDNAKNVALARRRRYLDWAKSYDIPIECIVFENYGAKEHAKRRYENDSRGLSYDYWLNIVARYHESVYSEPTLEEGFDKIHHISYQEILDGKVIE